MSGRVTILMPNGRRRNIRVTPNTTLLQVLEEACDKDGFRSEEYVLQHHRKDLPLSQMFRFSGLPNNCLLEMSPATHKRILCNVHICLQFEDGSRKQAEFMPDNNLWDIATRLSDDQVHQYKSPVVIYMRQEIIGQENMVKTTLKSLGIIEGKALMRIVDKDPEILKNQASVYVERSSVTEVPTNLNKSNETESRLPERSKLLSSNKKTSENTKNNLETTTKTSSSASPEKQSGGGRNNFKDITNDVTVMPTTSAAAAAAASASASVAADATKPTTSTKDVEQTPMEEEEPTFNIIGDRNALIYSLDAINRTTSEDLSDSFYDLTASDLKLVLRHLKDVAAGTVEAPLLTNDQRAEHEQRQKLEKISRFKCCVIRIKFNDNYVLQGMFKPTDSIMDVMTFTKSFLMHPEKSFYLFTIPPKTKLRADKTLLELELIPNALVYFAFDEDEKKKSNVKDTTNDIVSIIKPEFLEKLTSPEGATFAVKKLRMKC